MTAKDIIIITNALDFCDRDIKIIFRYPILEFLKHYCHHCLRNLLVDLSCGVCPDRYHSSQLFYRDL